MENRKTFKLALYQSHMERSNTETFEVLAEDEADARNQADNIAKDKGLMENFDWEVTPVEDGPASEVTSGVGQLDPTTQGADPVDEPDPQEAAAAAPAEENAPTGENASEAAPELPAAPAASESTGDAGSSATTSSAETIGDQDLDQADTST